MIDWYQHALEVGLQMVDMERENALLRREVDMLRRLLVERAQVKAPLAHNPFRAFQVERRRIGG
jgi:hypothetical protein